MPDVTVPGGGGGDCRAGHADQGRRRVRRPGRHPPPGPAPWPVPDDGTLPAGLGCPRTPGHGRRRRAATLPGDLGGGRPLADGAEVILRNPRLLRAASRLFDAEVVPSTVTVNVTAPMPAGSIHVDVPSFRGADRDRDPMQLLQAMAACGLFEDWRVIEAGAVWWSYQGRGGDFDYWPDGLDGPMRSEHPPFTNSALVADNNRMYHRIGQVGDPAAVPHVLSAAAQIAQQAGHGWIITDTGRAPVRYDDRDIRISVRWKAQVRPGPESRLAAPLTPELITEIISADLTRRGVQAPGRVASLSDQGWLDLVHSACYVPVRTATPSLARITIPRLAGQTGRRQRHGSAESIRRWEPAVRYRAITGVWSGVQRGAQMASEGRPAAVTAASAAGGDGTGRAADGRDRCDADVIRRSRHDPEHFAVLFRKYAPEIQRYVTRRIGAAEAEDVVAETFLAAFGQRESYDLARPDARPWLYGIATNLTGRRRRTEIRMYRALARTGHDPVTEPFTDRVDAAVSAAHAGQRLAAALAGLPAAYRDALLLVAWADLSYEQAADALGVPVGTVRSRAHRARSKLRRALGGTDPSALHEEHGHE